MPVSSERLDLSKHAWLREPALARLFDAIKPEGEARAVGGAVRDALLGRTVGEVDLAVNLPPEKVIELLGKAGVKTVPTGIDHGTITAVMNKRGYEITTLRHDVETDGRRAKVAFTDDWQADAARRDFTINALYAAADGTLYDYFGGREDIAVGRVRFIGDAEARIREDVLRILRFFRFTAWFGKGAPDAAGVEACRKLASLIPTLSVERVWREIIKLLAAENPAPAWQLMSDTGVRAQVLAEADNLTRLRGLLAAEAKYEMPPSPTVRLASLLPRDSTLAESIAARLKLSNREASALHMLATAPDRLKGKLDPLPFRRALYDLGADAARDGALLLAAENPALDIENALAEAASWERPTLPLQGNDILKLGVPAGPRVGDILKGIEEWWIAQDFRPARAECLAEAKTRAAA